MTRLVLAAVAATAAVLYMLGRRASGPAPADPTDSAGDYGLRSAMSDRDWDAWFDRMHAAARGTVS